MPKRRILPYIILGIVANQPGITGRKISDEFKNEIGDFWKASHSQVYPELRRMVGDQWLEDRETANNAKEKYYYLTNTGKNILNRWLAESVNEVPVHQDMFSLKLFFINSIDDPKIGQLIKDQLQLLTDELEHLKQRLTTVFPNQQAINQHYGHYLILTRAISRTAGQIEWLKQQQKRINNN